MTDRTTPSSANLVRETYRSSSVDLLRTRSRAPQPRLAVTALLGLARVGAAEDLGAMRARVPSSMERRVQFATNLLATRTGVESPVPLPYDPPLEPTRTPQEVVEAKPLDRREAAAQWAEVERWNPGTSARTDNCWALICRQTNRWLLAPSFDPRGLSRAMERATPTVLATVGRRGIDDTSVALDGYMLLYPKSSRVGFWTATGVLAMSGEVSQSPRGTTLWLRTTRSFGPLLHELRAHVDGSAWIVDRVMATMQGPARSAAAPEPARV